MKNKNVNFCWHCGRQLYGNHCSILNIHEYDRVLHKRCAIEILRDKLYTIWDELDFFTAEQKIQDRYSGDMVDG